MIDCNEWKTEKTQRMHKYGESKTTQIDGNCTSGSGTSKISDRLIFVAPRHSDVQKRVNKFASPKDDNFKVEKDGKCCVQDRARSERESIRHENCAADAASSSRSSKNKIRKRSSELGIPAAPMRRHIKTDCVFKIFRTVSVNGDSRNDLQNLQDACA